MAPAASPFFHHARIQSVSEEQLGEQWTSILLLRFYQKLCLDTMLTKQIFALYNLKFYLCSSEEPNLSLCSECFLPNR